MYISIHLGTSHRHSSWVYHLRHDLSMSCIYLFWWDISSTFVVSLAPYKIKLSKLLIYLSKLPFWWNISSDTSHLLWDKYQILTSHSCILPFGIRSFYFVFDGNISFDIRREKVPIHMTFQSFILPFGMSREHPLTFCRGLVLLCFRWEHLIQHSLKWKYQFHDLPVMDITIWYVKERPLTFCRGQVLLCIRWEHLIWHSSWISTNTHGNVLWLYVGP